MTSASQASIPRHVCIIMDGNGRWAKKRLMPRSYGHRKGVESTRQAVEYFAEAGVRYLTLFAFSSENWERPVEEVSNLMELFMQSLQQYGDELNEKKISIRFIGDCSGFSASLQKKIQQTESLTSGNQQMTLTIAANYGGRWDIVNAARKLAGQVRDGELQLTEIDSLSFAGQLSMPDCPDPDLFIRTGGEQRISNFLLWQLAYTEFYFCDSLWPDFSRQDMGRALAVYARRNRRYGKTDEQHEAQHKC